MMHSKTIKHTNLNDRVNGLKDYTLQMKQTINIFDKRIQDDVYLRNNSDITSLRDELLLSLNSMNVGVEMATISKDTL